MTVKLWVLVIQPSRGFLQASVERNKFVRPNGGPHQTQASTEQASVDRLECGSFFEVRGSAAKHVF